MVKWLPAKGMLKYSRLRNSEFATKNYPTFVVVSVGLVKTFVNFANIKKCEKSISNSFDKTNYILPIQSNFAIYFSIRTENMHDLMFAYFLIGKYMSFLTLLYSWKEIPADN